MLVCTCLRPTFNIQRLWAVVTVTLTDQRECQSGDPKNRRYVEINAAMPGTSTFRWIFHVGSATAGRPATRNVLPVKAPKPFPNLTLCSKSPKWRTQHKIKYVCLHTMIPKRRFMVTLHHIYPCARLACKPFPRPCSARYRGANKGLHVLLSRTQAGPGRTVKQEQEDISRNLKFHKPLFASL